MNEYIQQKLTEWRGKTLSDNEHFMKELGMTLEEVYNRGVEDSLKCVPEINSYPPNSEREELAQHQIRQQTIDNISKLKTNK